MTCSGERGEEGSSLSFLCRVFVASLVVFELNIWSNLHLRGFNLLRRDLPQPFSPPHGIRVEFTIHCTRIVEKYISLAQARLREYTIEKVEIQNWENWNSNIKE